MVRDLAVGFLSMLRDEKGAVLPGFTSGNVGDVQIDVISILYFISFLKRAESPCNVLYSLTEMQQK